MTTSIVIVSHSFPLAQALCDMSLHMTPGDTPRIEIAAGGPDGSLGTNASAITHAIEKAGADGHEVIVFVDIGSAIMSTTTALEFVDPDIASRTTISTAPLIEGVVPAVAMASLGLDRDSIDKEAHRGLIPKEKLLR